MSLRTKLSRMPGRTGEITTTCLATALSLAACGAIGTFVNRIGFSFPATELLLVAAAFYFLLSAIYLVQGLWRGEAEQAQPSQAIPTEWDGCDAEYVNEFAAETEDAEQREEVAAGA
ncbi:MAG TPA: hypothetical protein VL175_02110 [Pirellulales bacterium]|nr:hypothetical protein [Pirellulales bacterium]